MKLSLLNLVPLKEESVEFDSPAPEGMDIPNFDSLVDALKWKNDLENYSMDLENELKHAQRKFNDLLSGQGEMGAEPEGGPIQQKIAGELNQIKAREEELKQKLNTVLAKVDYFDQNYLGMNENLNEAKIKTKEEFDEIASAEQKAIEKKWDSLDTTIAFKKENPKQHTANMEAKQEYLTNLNKAGKLKKDYTADQIEDWSISSSLFGWKIASTVLKTPKKEGSCGYGPDGVPGDTPGETKGMPANNRTRTMLRKLIQKEIAKLSETK